MNEYLKKTVWEMPLGVCLKLVRKELQTLKWRIEQAEKEPGKLTEEQFAQAHGYAESMQKLIEALEASIHEVGPDMLFGMAPDYDPETALALAVSFLEHVDIGG